jgi:hypothetical protein
MAEFEEFKIIFSFMHPDDYLKYTEDHFINNYNKDWNVLMEVVYKILWLEEYDDDSYSEIHDALSTALLESTYEAVINFLKKHNKKD